MPKTVTSLTMETCWYLLEQIDEQRDDSDSDFEGDRARQFAECSSVHTETKTKKETDRN